MKNLLFLMLFIPVLVFSQNLPTPPNPGAAFPIGSKFTIKLYPVDSINFYYSIIEFEPFNDIVDTWKNDTLFTENGKDSTITFYFCLGTHGDTDAERKSNMQVLLLMKNYSKFSLNYTSKFKPKNQRKTKSQNSNQLQTLELSQAPKEQKCGHI